MQCQIVRALQSRGLAREGATGGSYERLPRDLYPQAATWIELLREAAAEGVANAQCELAYHYQWGCGELQKDEAKAAAFYKASADNPAAAHTGYASDRYARCLMRPSHGKQRTTTDVDEAIKYYRKAAALEDSGGFHQQDAEFGLAAALAIKGATVKGFTNDLAIQDAREESMLIFMYLADRGHPEAAKLVPGLMKQAEMSLAEHHPEIRLGSEEMTKESFVAFCMKVGQNPLRSLQPGCEAYIETEAYMRELKAKGTPCPW